MLDVSVGCWLSAIEAQPSSFQRKGVTYVGGKRPNTLNPQSLFALSLLQPPLSPPSLHELLLTDPMQPERSLMLLRSMLR